MVPHKPHIFMFFKLSEAIIAVYSFSMMFLVMSKEKMFSLPSEIALANKRYVFVRIEQRIEGAITRLIKNIPTFRNRHTISRNLS